PVMGTDPGTPKQVHRLAHMVDIEQAVDVLRLLAGIPQRAPTLVEPRAAVVEALDHLQLDLGLLSQRSTVVRSPSENLSRKKDRDQAGCRHPARGLPLVRPID